ncbi:MAG: hypothetical protein ACE5GS_14495 [Kiloniellaceae bacterium]
MTSPERRTPEALSSAREPGNRRVSALDRPAARVAAFGVFLLVAAALAWIHRDDLFPPKPASAPAVDDRAAQCLAGRAAGIDKMRADGVIDERQAALFKSRAEAFCQARFGPGSGPPPPRQ